MQVRQSFSLRKWPFIIVWNTLSVYLSSPVRNSNGTGTVCRSWYSKASRFLVIIPGSTNAKARSRRVLATWKTIVMTHSAVGTYFATKT